MPESAAERASRVRGQALDTRLKTFCLRTKIPRLAVTRHTINQPPSTTTVCPTMKLEA